MKDKIFDFLDKLSCEGKTITVSTTSPFFTTTNSFEEFVVVNENNSVEIMCGDTYYSINCDFAECMFDKDEYDAWMIHMEFENCVVEITGV